MKLGRILIMSILLLVAGLLWWLTGIFSTPKEFDLTSTQFECAVEQAISSNNCRAAFRVSEYYTFTRRDEESARRWWRIARMIETNAFLSCIGTNAVDHEPMCYGPN